jgi:hypothetical protein
MSLPFQETKLDSTTSIRVFGADIDPIELMWHRDDEARTIEPINFTDWLIQLENCLPFAIDHSININRHEWHRLIKGSGSLTLKIIKHKYET